MNIRRYWNPAEQFLAPLAVVHPSAVQQVRSLLTKIERSAVRHSLPQVKGVLRPSHPHRSSAKRSVLAA